VKLSKEIRFALCIFACAIFLHLFRFDDQRIAMLRLDESLQQDAAVPRTVSAKCGSLNGTLNTPAERYLVSKLLPSAGNAGPRCTLAVQSADTQRFYLRSTWAFAVRVSSERDGLLVQRSVTVGFPRPLCLLPFAILLFALLQGIRLPGFAWLTAGYIFLLGGLNVIQTFELLGSSLKTTLSAEPSIIGFALVAIWLAIMKHADPTLGKRSLSGPWETWGNRALAFTIGMWNPAIFTSLGYLLFPFRGHLARLKTFFDGQLLIAAASLYLFSFEFASFSSTVVKSLLLPRYFSFSVVAIFLMQYRRSNRGIAHPMWRLPHFWRAIGFVAVLEIVSLRVAPLAGLPTVTRVGIALLLSEIVWPHRIPWTPFFKTCRLWLGVLLLAYWLPVLASKTGICELALGLCDPRQHPSNFVLFTFLGAAVTAFVTGSFSLTFFTFYSLLVGTNQEPSVKAAFLDGVLAGSFLSPLSIHNLVPCAQFGLSMRDLMISRFQQLAAPLLMAVLIYAVTIPSVMILRPLAFTFLCLVMLTLELRKNNWVLASAPVR
jgi:hypothetical protein